MSALVVHNASFVVATPGRGTVDITQRVQDVVEQTRIDSGLCTVFVHHTSASLIVCENADPSVRADLERYFARAVVDGDPIFAHTEEGPDDMSAHVRSVLTQTSISIPVARGRCNFGTWQGLYLWEHRVAPHQRQITTTVIGQ